MMPVCLVVCILLINCEVETQLFFLHENQLYPPSLSDLGKLPKGQKSDLLKCFDFSLSPEVPSFFDCKVFDGAAVIHMLSPVGSQTFADYADNVFLSFIRRQLANADRVDIVWDT